MVQGFEWDEPVQMVCLTPAGIYYTVSRAPLFGENFRGITRDLPWVLVDAPWPLQAYYSPLPENVAPASDRLIRFDDNEANFDAALEAIDEVAELVRAHNEFGSREPETRDQKLEELKAIRGLLEQREGWTTKLLAVGWTALGYLISKFADEPLGYAAAQAWHALQTVIGLR
jgi:hypothetical protein